MDEDDDTLVEALLARIGAMLEDASAIALLKGERLQVERIEFVHQALRDAGSLLSAARSVAAAGAS